MGASVKKLLLSAIGFSVASVAPLMGSANEEGAASLTEGLSPSGVYPIVEEGPATFSMFNRVDPRAGGRQREEGGEGDFANFGHYYVTEYLSDKTNVHVDFVSAIGDGFIEKLKLMIRSKDLTDVVVCALLSQQA